jgi:peroxiredoxin
LPSTIEALHREYRPRGLAVLAVNMEEEPETVGAWVRSRRLTMDVLLDPPGVATRAWAVTATPATFLVGRDGRVVARGYGTRPWTGPEGRALIEALLAR